MAELIFIVDNTAIEVVRNTKITANFDEMKSALIDFVEPYKHLIVSEDGIASAKADRAKIRSVASHIDGYRKTVKKLYNEPYKEFENKCKELLAICDEGVVNLDEQVKAFDEKRKDEKKFLLRDYYDNAFKKHPDEITFDLCLHPKWENKGTSLDECHRFIDETISKTDKEIDAIIALNSEWQFALLDQYRQTHDMVDVLMMHQRLTDSKNEAKKKLDNEMNAEPRKETYEPESLYKVTLNLWCTYPQIQSVRNQLKGMGIHSELVDTIETKVPYTQE